MSDAFIFCASIGCFWLTVEASVLMGQKNEPRYGWIGLAFFACGLFGIYALIVGK